MAGPGTSSLLSIMKQLELFDLPKTQSKFKNLFSGLRRPIWTENKARMIAIYLRLFVYITKHGAYIDGFAGPQQPRLPDRWTAKLVIESQPKRLRQFFLCELNEQKLKLLRALVKRAREEDIAEHLNRLIELYEGDFNIKVHEIIAAQQIKENTATFCLLDQHTFECKWATVKALAEVKRGMKIELFYFVPTGWLKRALAATRRVKAIRDWWGRDDWTELKSKSSLACAQAFCDRFRDELGYKHAYAWPIFERSSGRRIMYYMIHATDHDEAPKLMHRAYKGATGQITEDQLLLNL